MFVLNSTLKSYCTSLALEQINADSSCPLFHGRMHVNELSKAELPDYRIIKRRLHDALMQADEKPWSDTLQAMKTVVPNCFIGFRLQSSIICQIEKITGEPV